MDNYIYLLKLNLYVSKIFLYNTSIKFQEEKHVNIKSILTSDLKQVVLPK